MPEGQSTEAVAVKPIRWHRHRWSQWDKPYASGGIVGAFGGGLLRQKRSCEHCGMVQDRSCVVES